MSYIHNKKWRLKNIPKRNEQRKRYYAKSSKEAYNNRRLWNYEDLKEIILHRFSDRILSTVLGRSVQAIQIRRSRYFQEEEK